METVIAAVISSVATLIVAFLHRKKYFNKREKIVDDLKTKLSISDSNVIIIAKTEDIPRRLLKSDGTEQEQFKQISKIIIIKWVLNIVNHADTRMNF